MKRTRLTSSSNHAPNKLLCKMCQCSGVERAEQRKRGREEKK